MTEMQGQGSDTPGATPYTPPRDPERYFRGVEVLFSAVQALSFTREPGQVQRIVKTAARQLTGSDGACFVLRDGASCHFVDEDAVTPLWKGMRVPLSSCIEGSAMLHRQPVLVRDVAADDRVLPGAYDATFVRSLAVVPVRGHEPVGAIGVYWAAPGGPDEDDLRLLSKLADAVSLAIENIRIHGELEERVRLRAAELDKAKADIEELSITDELTGLLNRRGFRRAAEAILAGGNGCQLAFIDVDGLKKVNDKFGHTVGDSLIADCASVLRDSVRQSDIVGRMGGDEFCVLVQAPLAPAEALRNSLRTRLDYFNRLSPAQCTLSISVGIVQAKPGGNESLDDLLSQADALMSMEKHSKSMSKSRH
ncbi:MULTISPECIES: GGDEF domain-containing protein [Kaistia]|uniref:diguanylate cyclase n=1 Tax=Kaistia nematophila TaxID=2994654 RepID=A0A9X3IIY6_9HYPH|nr:sensor domain-containing diguanylate cyclase [Kaistia nematophila]MCX5567873.1 sensor domain-containing diguanylate cyclase [Kaistia nematophila]